MKFIANFHKIAIALIILSMLTGCAKIDQIGDALHSVLSIAADQPAGTDGQNPGDTAGLDGEGVPVPGPTEEVPEQVDPIQYMIDHDPLGFYTDDVSDYQFTDQKVDYVVDQDNKAVYLLNYELLDDFIGTEAIRLEDVFNSIDSNEQVPDEYKAQIKAFTKRMSDYYGTIDFRIYNYNMQHLTIKSLTQEEREEQEIKSLATFDYDGTLITMDDTADLSVEYDKMLFNHELGHAFNNVCVCEGQYKVFYQFNYNFDGKYFKEAADSIFTVEPYISEYSRKTILKSGYSITKGVVKVLLDVGNLSFNDTITKNIYDITCIIDAISNDSKSFDYIEDLLELQWIEHRDGKVVLDHEYYNEEYEYITKLYLDRYATSGMSEAEYEQLKETYLTTLTESATKFDTVGYDGIDRAFEQYKVKLGIGDTIE